MRGNLESAVAGTYVVYGINVFNIAVSYDDNTAAGEHDAVCIGIVSSHYAMGGVGKKPVDQPRDPLRVISVKFVLRRRNFGCGGGSETIWHNFMSDNANIRQSHPVQGTEWFFAAAIGMVVALAQQCRTLWDM